MKKKAKEEPIKIGDKVTLCNQTFTVIGLWAGDIAVIENDAHRYTVEKDRLKRV